MGCLPQSASFKVIKLDFLTYLFIVVKPWFFVQESEVAMQLDVALEIRRGCLQHLLFVEGRPLVSLFTNVLGALSLL